jgi:hypothetical protein
VRFEALAFRYEVSYNNSKKENWVLIGSLQYIYHPQNLQHQQHLCFITGIYCCAEILREEEFHRSWSYAITECVHEAEVQRLHHMMASHIHPIDVRFFLVDISIAYPPNNFFGIRDEDHVCCPREKRKAQEYISV